MKSSIKKNVLVLGCIALLGGCVSTPNHSSMGSTSVTVPTVERETFEIVMVYPVNYKAVKEVYRPVNKRWYRNPSRAGESLLHYIEDLERNNKLLECVMADKVCNDIGDKEEESE